MNVVMDKENMFYGILGIIASGLCMQLIMDENGMMRDVARNVSQFKEKHIYLMLSESKFRSLSEPFRIFTTAHEETHVLDYTGNFDALEDKLLLEQQVKISLNSLDHEIAANIGGYYALKSRNLRILSNLDLTVDFILDADMVKAHRIYLKSKIPKKEYFIIINDGNLHNI